MPVLNITPKAAAAIDLLSSAIVRFQNELAPLDVACSAMVDVLQVLKAGGRDFDPKTIAALDQLGPRLAAFPKAAAELSILGPMIEIIETEIGLDKL